MILSESDMNDSCLQKKLLPGRVEMLLENMFWCELLNGICRLMTANMSHTEVTEFPKILTSGKVQTQINIMRYLPTTSLFDW